LYHAPDFSFLFEQSLPFLELIARLLRLQLKKSAPPRYFVLPEPKQDRSPVFCSFFATTLAILLIFIPEIATKRRATQKVFEIKIARRRKSCDTTQIIKNHLDFMFSSCYN
jgi:hypothetical protein